MLPTNPTAFALSIPDILLLILDHLPAADLEAACALARLARTSRAWSDPALAALWHILPSPAPLRALMPSADEAGRPEAWRVFDDHAARVRTWGPDTRFLAHVFHRRRSPLPPPLPPPESPPSPPSPPPPSPTTFPALRTVGLQSDAPIPPATRLPHLHTAHLYFSYWSPAPAAPAAPAWDPLRFLAAAAPALTTLSLAGRVPPAALAQLRGLRALDRLDLARAELPAGAGALRVLGGARVRRLVLPRGGFPESEYAPSVAADRGAKEAMATSTSAGTGFAHLEHLHLPSTTPAAANAFLACLAAPAALRSVAICSPTALHAPAHSDAHSHSDAGADWGAVLARLPRGLHTLRLHTTDGRGVPLRAFAQLARLRMLDADVCVCACDFGVPADAGGESGGPGSGSGVAMKRARLRLHHPPRTNTSANTSTTSNANTHANTNASTADGAGEPDAAGLAQVLDAMWPALERLTVVRDSGPGPYYDMRRDGWEAEGYGEEYSYGGGGGRGGAEGGEDGGDGKDGKEEVWAGVWEAVRGLQVARARV